MAGTAGDIKDATNEVAGAGDNNPSTKKDKIVLPAKEEFVGELLSVSELEDQKIMLLSVQGANDDIITLSTSTNYWKKIGKLFPEGSIVKASYEQRIANKTGYDDNGTLVAHTANGNSLVGINRFSVSAWQRQLDTVTKDADLGTLSAVEIERVSAVATYLSAYVRK